MIVRILVLEDVEVWGRKLCASLESFESDFFEKIGTGIRKIMAIPVFNSTDALKVLQTEQIDLITLDIQLNESTTGHEFYEQMFLKGIDKPSIVVSGEVDTPQIRKQILGTGVPIIVRKLSEGEPVHVRVAKAICEVLDSQRHLVFQLSTYVEHYDLREYHLEINGKTQSICHWINDLVDNIHKHDDIILIRKKIVEKCIEQSKFEQRSM